MKKALLLLTLILSASFRLAAQTVFAPPGSEWYHTQDYGVFHSYYAGDTTIASINCRKIIREAQTEDPYYSTGLHVYNLSTLYVYNTTDTVFIYNTFFKRFTPLYVFNVNDGDTIHLPILPIDVDMLLFASTDSTFSIKVDSVRIVLYDTAALKTIYTHPIGNTATNYVYSYSGYGDTAGDYAERIGTISAGLLPRGLPAANLADDHLQYADSIRCYNDPTLSIKLTTGLCGIPPTQLSILNKQETISLSPNPATTELTITSTHLIANVTIINTMGQTVYKHNQNANEVHVNISNLPYGLYLIRVNDTMVRKFIKE